MTPEELDCQLRAITAHEAVYRRGGTISYPVPFPTEEIDGKTVTRFSYSSISLASNGTPFLFKRHSRFRDYPWHMHDWIELSYVWSGSCVQLIRDERVPMTEGQLLLMPPGVVHTLEPLGENDILVQIALGRNNLDHNFFNRISSGGIVPGFLLGAFRSPEKMEDYYLFPTGHNRRLRVFITEFLCEWHAPSSVSYDMQNDLFSLIVSELVNTLSASAEDEARSRQRQHVLPVLRYIESNYRSCTLQSAAEHFAMHPNYLSSLLKKYTGNTFNELVQQEKLAAAEKLLLDSDMSVTDIADFVGYQNVSFFYRLFREKNSCQPGEYRRRTRR